MAAPSPLLHEIRKLLRYGDLPFRDFVELALYHPEFGYYTQRKQRVGKSGDYITAPLLSPVFSFVIAGLFREFLSRREGVVCSFVDMGCGDGSLLAGLAAQIDDPGARFYGVDRSLSRLSIAESGRLRFFKSLDQVPRNGSHFFFSSELYDALPFARLVQREEHLHELWVTERDGMLDWTEHEAPAAYEDYFRLRGLELAPGQFADISLEWQALHDDIARFVTRGLIVTLDFGFSQQKLFHPTARRFGTAAAYSQQRVSRDLLANPGEQDLTAHINFTDLECAGERQGMNTLFFDRLARFLLAAGATEHPLFRPIEELEIPNAEAGLALRQEREDARRLVLPDGIGDEMRVLVQSKGFPVEGWSFQRRLF